MRQKVWKNMEKCSCWTCNHRLGNVSTTTIWHNIGTFFVTGLKLTTLWCQFEERLFSVLEITEIFFEHYYRFFFIYLLTYNLCNFSAFPILQLMKRGLIPRTQLRWRPSASIFGFLSLNRGFCILLNSLYFFSALRTGSIKRCWSQPTSCCRRLCCYLIDLCRHEG